MEADPGERDRREPPAQPGAERHLRRKALDRPTPVVGTAQPPRGLSGLLRKRAYGIPEHRARHWMLLLLADRIDVVEGRVGSTLATPLEALGAGAGSKWVRRNPLLAAGGLAAAAWIGSRALRRSRSESAGVVRAR